MKKIELKNIIKESIADYLSELNTTDHLEEELIDETPITEEVTELENNISKDGKIYLVRKPNKDTAEGGIVEEKSISELIGADYIGVFTSKEKAAAFGKKALKQRDAELKENVKKGQAKVGDLETQIATLKVDMQKLIDNPDTRSELGSYTARLEKFEALLDKLKSALGASSSKKDKKEDEEKEGLNEGDPNAVYYLVKSASTGKILVKMASKHASKSVTGNQRFKSEEEAQKEADKRNEENEK